MQHYKEVVILSLLLIRFKSYWTWNPCFPIHLSDSQSVSISLIHYKHFIIIHSDFFFLHSSACVAFLQRHACILQRVLWKGGLLFRSQIEQVNGNDKKSQSTFQLYSSGRHVYPGLDGKNLIKTCKIAETQSVRVDFWCLYNILIFRCLNMGIKRRSWNSSDLGAWP